MPSGPIGRYDIETVSGDQHRISVAVAGFKQSGIEITQRLNPHVTGRKECANIVKSSTTKSQHVTSNRSSPSPTTSKSAVRAWKAGRYALASLAACRKG